MESWPLLLVLFLLVKISSGKDCPAGWYLNSKNQECTPCPAGSYTENPNHGHSCNRCRQCIGGKFLILASCTSISNTKCQCVEGFMCTNKECKSCEAHKVCKKGQQVQQKGDSFRNTVCSDCRNGTYSDREGGVCKPWTDCSAKRLQVLRNGSQTEDAICGAPVTVPQLLTTSVRPTIGTPRQPDNPLIEDATKNEGIVGIAALILLSCSFIPFTLYLAVQNRKKKKHLALDVTNHEDLPVALMTVGDDRCSCHCPEEEVGDWQLRQETTPKPPE
ncbi:tumor necrosis factor receptor superfamily member 9-like [Rhincodon typus]|uniref:tumor necrosis factor receptor superfamily member 9-like n=1 Tax=Rhincodon typus TaxID=259920 RepID=UPI0009A30F7D|nr:tumor necrosis factor receptor superfamily member 9-like [Rhincodon typus]